MVRGFARILADMVRGFARILADMSEGVCTCKTPKNHTSLWKYAVYGFLTIQESGVYPPTRNQPDAERLLLGR